MPSSRFLPATRVLLAQHGLGVGGCDRDAAGDDYAPSSFRLRAPAPPPDGHGVRVV